MIALHIHDARSFCAGSGIRSPAGLPGRTRYWKAARGMADWARTWYAEHGRPWIYAQTVPRPGERCGRLARWPPNFIRSGCTKP